MTPRPCQFPLDPHEQLLVFDGICRVCSGWARFLLRFDTNARISLTTIQSKTGEAILSELGLDQAPLETLVFVTNGIAYFQTDAILRVLGQLPAGWRFLLLLYVIPHPIRDWLYVRLARNRYRWFGQRDTCFVPDASTEARFRN